MPPKKNKRKGGDRSHPSASAIRYRGGTDLRSDRAENMITASLVIHTYVTTVSVANVVTYNTTFPVVGAAGAADWTSYRSLYQEFRVLAETVNYMPKFANNQFNTNSAAAVVFATDRKLSQLYLLPYHGDATAIANITSAVNHRQPGSTHGALDQPLRASVRMDESDEAAWSATTASATFPVFGIKTYFEGATNGATDTVEWGSIIATYVIQFRGRVDVSTQISRVAESLKQPTPQGEDECKDDPVIVDGPALARHLAAAWGVSAGPPQRSLAPAIKGKSAGASAPPSR